MTTEQSEINLVCILSQKDRSLKVIIGLRIGFMVAFKRLFLEVYLHCFVMSSLSKKIVAAR